MSDIEIPGSESIVKEKREGIVKEKREGIMKEKREGIMKERREGIIFAAEEQRGMSKWMGLVR